MIEDLFDHRRIFDARDHLDRAIAMLAGQDVGLEQIAPGDFVQRLEHDIRGAVTVRGLETVANIPLGR